MGHPLFIHLHAVLNLYAVIFSKAHFWCIVTKSAIKATWNYDKSAHFGINFEQISDCVEQHNQVGNSELRWPVWRPAMSPMICPSGRHITGLMKPRYTPYIPNHLLRVMFGQSVLNPQVSSDLSAEVWWHFSSPFVVLSYKPPVH